MNSQDQIISTIKAWIAPILISVIGMFIWRDMSELRQDVKVLLAITYENEAKIQYLEEAIKELKNENKELKIQKLNFYLESAKSAYTYTPKGDMKEEEKVKIKKE